MILFIKKKKKAKTNKEEDEFGPIDVEFWNAIENGFKNIFFLCMS